MRGLHKCGEVIGNIGARPFDLEKTEKRILFLKNKPGKLLEAIDKSKKTNRNEAETKLPMSLKIKEGPKKRTGNEPENEAGQVIENKRCQKRTAYKPEPSRRCSPQTLPATLLCKV